MLVRPRPGEAPRPPPEIASEVEQYAREFGRHATLHFVPFGGWFVRFSLRPNDKRLRAYQEGSLAQPPAEDVWLHVQNPPAGKRTKTGAVEPQYLPLNLYDMGASGVREFLERGNTWSGRGEHASVEAALRTTEETNEESRKRFREEQRFDSVKEQCDKRRSRFKIPFIPVGIDFGKHQGGES